MQGLLVEKPESFYSTLGFRGVLLRGALGFAGGVSWMCRKVSVSVPSVSTASI